MSHSTTIPIDIAGRPTSLVVERGAATRLATLFAQSGVEVNDRRILLVIDRHVSAVAARVATSLAAAHAHVSVIHVDATEAKKSMEAVDAIWHAALAARVDRSGLFIAIGGGLVGDLAGFAAATYLRGVDLVQLPTTLLAMVDSSIGGKTGINLALPGGGLGKNLAGAFWQPRLTVADADLLSTLPARELRAGFAECVKHAVIAGEQCFADLEKDAALLCAGDAAAFDRLIPSSAAVKAAIVSRDPHERGERAKLNLGHTFGHAIETMRGLDLLHGEAVAIGLHAAVRCAEARGLLSPQVGERIVALVERVGLPIRLPMRVSAADIEHRMGFDKKNQGGALRLVLPRAIGEVSVEQGADQSSVHAALAAIGASI